MKEISVNSKTVCTGIYLAIMLQRLCAVYSKSEILMVTEFFC